MAHFGSTFPFLEYEHRRIRCIPAKLSLAEPELYVTKWWDYRPLHPMQATYLFAECYRLAVVHSLRRRIDVYQAENYHGMKREDFLRLDKGSRTGMWRARQTADRYGIPYDFWCYCAMKYAEKNLWQHVPTPAQLYGKTVRDEHAHFKIPMVQYITARWQSRLGENFLCAKSEFYKAENYCQHEYQVRHLQFIKRQLLRCKNRAMVIAELIGDLRVLTPPLVVAMFGTEAEGLLQEVSALLSHNREDLIGEGA